MAREIVVPIAAASTRRISASALTASALILVIAVTIGGSKGTTIPIKSVWLLQNGSSSFGDDSNSVALIPIVLLLILALANIFFGDLKTSVNDKEAAVIVYPLGIQMVRRKAGSTKHVEPVNFFAWDQVLDCVVVEHIKAWKVTSVVMIRLKCLSATGEKDFALIEAFPGSAEMSYEKCLDLRSRILRAFTAEIAILQCNQRTSKRRKQKERPTSCRN